MVGETIRTLLEETFPDATVEVVDRTGGGDHFHVTVESGAEATSSPSSERVLSIISERAAKEGEVVAPVLGLEATDARHLRRLGVRVYGYAPIAVTREDLESIRGRNEKISWEQFASAMKVMTAIAADLASE